MPIARHDRLHVRLSRNLALFPWARDSRVKLDWNQKAGRWWADLNRNVRFLLPTGTPERLRRAPTAFDYQLMCLLLAEGWRDKVRVRFPSQAQVLRAIGYPVDSRHREQLADSLRYWSALRVDYDRWHQHGTKGKPGKKIAKVLPPLVRKFDLSGQTMIDIDDDWLDTCAGYYAPSVLLPLPRDVTALNLVIWLLTQDFEVASDNVYGRCKFARFKPVIRSAIGIGASHGGARLRSAIAEAADWFDKMGGRLTPVPVHRTIAIGFLMDPPPIPQTRVRIRKDEMIEMVRSASGDDREWTPARTEDGTRI